MRIRQMTISAVFAGARHTADLGRQGAIFSSSLLAVPAVLAVLRRGGRRWHRRDDRHRAGLGDNRGTALLLRVLLAALFPAAGLFSTRILRAPKLLPATLSPRLAPVSLLSYVPCWVGCSTNRLITLAPPRSTRLQFRVQHITWQGQNGNLRQKHLLLYFCSSTRFPRMKPRF